MATFVLVPGAGYSGWCWHQVVPLLRAAGHEAIPITLTGLGERAHLLSREVGLDTHVQDVLGVLEYDDLREVILVGWSYAGMVITAVAESAPERLSHLVYLDAAVPHDGECLAELISPELLATIEEQARTVGKGICVPVPGESSFDAYVERGELTRDQVTAIVSKIRPQPLKPGYDTVQITNPATRAVSRTFIYCALGKSAKRGQSVERVQADPNWRYHELRAGHLAALTHPRPLADLLLQLA
jgi:pimeloyl-ACP methyl ester carboxylesterase